jgi:hypothetical protein
MTNNNNNKQTNKQTKHFNKNHTNTNNLRDTTLHSILIHLNSLNTLQSCLFL